MFGVIGAAFLETCRLERELPRNSRFNRNKFDIGYSVSNVLCKVLPPDIPAAAYTCITLLSSKKGCRLYYITFSMWSHSLLSFKMATVYITFFQHDHTANVNIAILSLDIKHKKLYFKQKDKQ